MRNFKLGVGRRDLILFVGATLLVIAFTIVWTLFLVDFIGSLWRGEEQRINKYFLALFLLGLAGAVTLVSLGVAQRGGGRPDIRALLPGFMVRFGLALQVFGICITPIGLYYATDPTRSVPLGFAAFTAVFLGLFIAGFGGNMIAPRRA